VSTATWGHKSWLIIPMLASTLMMVDAACLLRPRPSSCGRLLWIGPADPGFGWSCVVLHIFLALLVLCSAPGAAVRLSYMEHACPPAADT
jgi:hypothetical protein